MTFPEGPDCRYGIWVDFNCAGRGGHVTSFTDFAEPGVNLAVGKEITAGDNEGNRCPAVIESITWPTAGGPGTVVLRLDLDWFEPAGKPAP